MNNFTDFPPCKHRFACMQCRNDPKFIENMEKRFGKWECPEGISIGTSLEDMPEHIQGKIKSYQKRLKEKVKQEIETINRQTVDKPKRSIVGESTLDRSQDRALSNNRSKLIQNTDFTKLPMCRQRVVCNECRNNKDFRERMEKTYGKWECPEGILVGTPMDKMPVKIQNIDKSKKNKAKANKELVAKIRQDVLDIESVIPPQASEKFDRIKYYLFPEMKDSGECIHKGENKKVKEKCCGGKIKLVDGFECKIKGRGDVTKKVCRHCKDFKRK